MTAARAPVILLGLLFAGFLLGGCAAPTGAPTTIAVSPGDYERTFEAARLALLDFRFELDRVDGRAGVLSTRSKATAGLATPWDTEQTHFSQEVEDFLSDQSREVRITFTPEGESPPEGAPASLAPGEPFPDRRVEVRPMTARVEVVVFRRHRPGWRPSTGAIARSSFAEDPSLGPRSMLPRYSAAVMRDEALARRIVQRIGAHLR